MSLIFTSLRAREAPHLSALGDTARRRHGWPLGIAGGALVGAGVLLWPLAGSQPTGPEPPPSLAIATPAPAPSTETHASRGPSPAPPAAPEPTPAIDSVPTPDSGTIESPLFDAPDPALLAMRQIAADFARACAADRLDEADQLLAQAEAMIGPDSLAVVRMRAFLQLRRGELEAARQAYQEVLGYDADDLEANLNLAAIDWREGALAEARQRVARLYSRHPNNPDVRQHHDAYSH
ncbi:MAG: tetratricopeptide repeat protein [Marichromatium sp.]|uniref:tetratricopeptide repeat protein n=1 Tax=Marichromatium sp. PS1 TaxID=3138932 RepID=UPI001B2B820B|nr:tetratricopeptide repeat protein [Marichromatium sp.]